MTNGSVVFQGTKEEAIKYFASIGFIKEQKLMTYPDFFIKIIKLNLTDESETKYNLLPECWKNHIKELKIEYTKPIETKFKRFSMIKKAATILMSNLSSDDFFSSIYHIILPNIIFLYNVFKVSKYILKIKTNQIEFYPDKSSNIKIPSSSNIFNMLHEFILDDTRFCHDLVFEEIDGSKTFSSYWKDNPILIIGVYLF
ncbi:hypothetical protein HERIO_2584 [Hepatospora eriocheir]|uniref:Uncharacterized protein n=1 Tax=Hepatospora eriocheir TaxID=1081669 RepID=A0A1X0Q6C7_9MICR|nr:hypothetical protein HERIO_2584 [Hepatospora eriocheir]